MSRRQILLASFLIALCFSFASTSWAQPQDKPADRTPIVDQLVGSTTKPAPGASTAPASRPVAKAAPTSQPVPRRVAAPAPPKPLDPRAEAMAWIRWAQMGGRFTSREIMMLDLARLSKKHPNDHTIAFFHAFLAQTSGYPQAIKDLCQALAGQPHAYLYQPYCQALKAGRVTVFNTLPSALAAEWFEKLYPRYQKNPKDRNMRFHLITLLVRNMSHRGYREKNRALLRKLLQQDLEAHPNDMWSQVYWLSYRIRAGMGRQSKLPFLLVEAQQLAKKYPHHVAPQLLLLRLMDRMKVRQGKQELAARIESLVQGKSLHHFFIRYLLQYQDRSKRSQMLSWLQKEIAQFTPTQYQALEVQLLSRMVSRLAWRHRKGVQMVYKELLQRFPHHPTVLIDAAANLSRLGQKEEANKLYLRAIPLVDNLRTLRTLFWKVSNYRTRPLALKLLNHYLQRFPGNTWALSQRAYTYNLLQQKDKAEQDYNALLQGKKALSPRVYLQMANFYQRDEDLPRALAILARAIKAFPKDSNLYSTRAPILAKMGKREEAEKDYLKAFHLRPTYYWLGYSYVRFLQKTQQHEKALQFTKKQLDATKNKRNQKQWQNLYVKTLMKAGKHKEAHVFALRSGNANALLSAARTSKRAGKNTEALQYLKMALKRNPKSYTARSIYTLMASIYLAQRDYKKAEEAYRQNIRLSPKYYYNYYSLARFYTYRMNQPQHAIQVWNDYLKVAPNNARAYYERAQAYHRAKDTEAAIKDYLHGLELSKKTRYDYMRIANFLRYKVKRPKQALELWDKYIAGHSKDADAYRERGSIHVAMKQYEKAEADYQMAIKLKPKYLYNYSRLATMYRYNMRQPQKALDLWTDFIANNPKNPDAYRNRANLYRQQKQYEKAVADYEAAIRIRPNYAYSYSSLASIYNYYLKDYDKAAAVWTRYIQRKQYDDYGYIERAKVYARQKAWDKALTDWNSAAKRSSRTWRRVSIYKGRAEAYQALQQYDAALKDLQMAFKATSSKYSRRSIIKAMVENLEAKGSYAEALKKLSTMQTSRWDRSVLFTKVRLMVGAGQLDQALAQAQSYCSGPERITSTYYRKRACRHHAWLAYAMQTLQPPVTTKAFDRISTKPGRTSQGGKNFRSILKLLLQGSRKFQVRTIPRSPTAVPNRAVPARPAVVPSRAASTRPAVVPNRAVPTPRKE